MMNLAAISQEGMEKSLLISLILILGVILYLKLIRGLKQKRLNQSFASIIGYDKEGENIVINYSIPVKIDSEFIFKSPEGTVLYSLPIFHESKGEYSISVPSVKFNGEFVLLSLSTNRQKISKKIYLNI